LPRVTAPHKLKTPTPGLHPPSPLTGTTSGQKQIIDLVA